MVYKFNVRVYQKTVAEKIRTSPLIVLSILLAALCIPIMRFVTAANSLSDTTPMEFVSLSLPNGNTVDVSNDVGYVDILGEIYEDLSGFDSLYYSYASPSGNQVVEGDLNGDPQYINSNIQFPRYAETGVWRPTFTLKDNATNVRVYTPDELATLGFLVDITVTSSASDTSAPVLSDMTFDVASVDTANAEAVWTGTMTIDEDLAGMDFGQSYLIFESPSGNQKNYGHIDQGPGNVYTFLSIFQRYTEVGEWKVSVQLRDKVGNTVLYDNTEIASMNLPTTMTATGNPDTSYVTIDNLYFSAAFPPLGDQIASSSKITIYGQFSDNLSGVGNVDIFLRSQTTNQVAPVLPTTVAQGVYQYTAFMPVYAATGLWLPEIITSDYAGNNQTLSHNDLLNLGIDLSVNVVGSETDTVTDDGQVTTDTDNDGATVTQPFVASVTTPIGGDITITQVDLNNPISTNDFAVFDQQYDISAPDASAEEPLVLAFTVDSSQLGEITAENIVVFRNGEMIQECTDPVQAVPDPCVATRTTLPDGDVQVTVRSSHASIWYLGYATPTGPSYTFRKFKNGIKPAPALNKEKSGSTVPVKFSLGGDFGLSVLPEEIATSQQVVCSSKVPVGSATPINTTGNGLTIHGENDDDEDEEQPHIRYKFNWKTMKNWKDTCRSLQLNFSNGEEVIAYFDFR